MTKQMRLLALLVIPLTLLLGCSGGRMDEQKKVFASLKEIPESAWQRLAEKRIYFGHQSVGENILAGIRDLMKENPQIRLNLVKTHDPAAFNIPVFAESDIGKNEDPTSKCQAFGDYMVKGLGNKVDIAFFKFCFVDVTADTDVDQVFTEYRTTLARLKEKYPKTLFVHVTVPLTTVQTGVKVWVKQIIGRRIGGYDENMQRGKYNERLIKEYGGKEPIFDLGRIESTYPDGARSSFPKDGHVYYSLVPAYTYDGGHLNERARKLVAEQLLVLLASLSR
jgi:hypothetical protein